MKAEDILMFALTFVAGVLLAFVYFGGLWFTINHVERVKKLPLFFGLSFVLRMGFILGGFYLVSQGKIERMIVCLVAFFLTRQILIMRAKPYQFRKADTDGNQP